MKRKIEIPEDLDSKIQAFREARKEIGANSSYGEVVRCLLVIGLYEMEKAGKLPDTVTARPIADQTNLRIPNAVGGGRRRGKQGKASPAVQSGGGNERG